jgi:23S rRNA pseudouridine2605 synthase
MDAERLSKFLSRSGVASRRRADEIIREGEVTVNGTVVLDPYYRVVPSRDMILVHGRKVQAPSRLHYIALNKPKGFISDLSDPRGRSLARDLIASEAMLFPVGRLDYTSEGLMLFTNDGDLANRVTHPRFGVEKEYLLKVKGKLTDPEMALFTKGITVQGTLYRAKHIVPLKPSLQNFWYRVVLAEGKNRMLRLMGDAIGHPVLKLQRVRIGPVHLGGLALGASRPLTPTEIRGLVQPEQSRS